MSREIARKMSAALFTLLGVLFTTLTVGLHLYFEVTHQQNSLAMIPMFVVGVLFIWIGGWLANSPLAEKMTHEVEVVLPSIVGMIPGLGGVLKSGRRTTDVVVVPPAAATEVEVPPRPIVTDHDHGEL